MTLPKNKRDQYAVFVSSYKRSHYKPKRLKNPDYPNLSIIVRPKALYEDALNQPHWKQADVLKLKKPKRYKRIVQVFNPQFADSKLRAFKIAFKLLDELRKAGKKVRVYGSPEDPIYSVYAMKLKDTVKEYGRFKKDNPGINIRSENDCYYVGQTQYSIIQRYENHINEDSNDSTPWGKRYFIKPFEDAFDRDLVFEFETETGKATSGLTHFESLLIEDELTKWIRSKGMYSYSR